MINQSEFLWIKEALESGRVNAIVANKTIGALNNQQREIIQLKQQLKNCQSECWNLKKKAYR